MLPQALHRRLLAAASVFGQLTEIEIEKLVAVSSVRSERRVLLLCEHPDCAPAASCGMCWLLLLTLAC